jgi:chromate transporter
MSKPSLLNIFISFFRIGLFTIGGGYAMLPLIQREVVTKQKWMDEDTFMDGIAAAQSCPGPIAVNLSVYAGYHVAGWNGLLLAVLGTILPSFLIILVIALSFSNWADLPVVQKAFHGLRPAVTALIAVPVVQMMQKTHSRWYNYAFTLIAVVLIVYFHVSPVYLISFTILLAWFKYLYRATSKKEETD